MSKDVINSEHEKIKDLESKNQALIKDKDNYKNQLELLAAQLKSYQVKLNEELQSNINLRTSVNLFQNKLAEIEKQGNNAAVIAKEIH